MKSTFISFVVSILGFLSFSKSYACSCVHIPLAQSLTFTNLVLVGKFIQGDKLWEISEIGKNAPVVYYTGRFVVKEVLKGNNVEVGDTLNVTTDHDNCSSLYKNETEYIFFGDGPPVKSSICSYTRVFSNEEGKKIYKQTRRLLKKPQRT